MARGKRGPTRFQALVSVGSLNTKIEAVKGGARWGPIVGYSLSQWRDATATVTLYAV